MKHHRSFPFQEPFNLRLRVSINRRPLASTAAISLSFAIVFSCCVTVSAGEFSLSAPVLFEGAVDGSAAADVGDGFFVGATDEDNELRLYDIKGGPSPKTLDVGVEAAVKSALAVEKIKECDLEGAAKIGDLIFWIGSHGRNKDAKEKKNARSCSQRNLVDRAKMRSSRSQERFTQSFSTIC
jgi:hypothetical protein